MVKLVSAEANPNGVICWDWLFIVVPGFVFYLSAYRGRRKDSLLRVIRHGHDIWGRYRHGEM